ncbi:signal peptidase II [Haloimpatiens lingqiaonensis]|uniref:signal peptidase II n=1 Tax=Haloimpatiens lingqiaonensis TaxID=1380675 RepID=UPI0010FDE872|nr:signal peptidase II [Haloimpatiens lingqiaonensis]
MEISIIIFGVLLDRLTKYWSVNILSKIGEIKIIDKFFSFYYLENTGAAFGIMKNKIYFLSIVTVLVLGGIIYYLLFKRPKDKLIRISLSLIIAGAIGNLVDRVLYKYVIDFILLHFKDVYYFPVFNVADILVCIGTFLLIIFLIKEDKDEGTK